MKTSNEIRKEFLEFFKNKSHTIVPSAPVIPHGDTTLLFTNAGMNQFKEIFLGQGKRDYNRAADTQKCIRVSGKHNDLEEVGVDSYHHTFFEMLGNWSFGDYYKEEAIQWAWELLTEVWKLDKKRLFVTVYRTDDEAFEIWKKYIDEDRILRFDEKDNFWEMGETGPCGPCSEIHYDGTDDFSGKHLVNQSDENVIEIWNLVFIQFNRKIDGSLEELKDKHVDTGMGFERIVRTIQNKKSNYDTDIFMPIINKLEKLSGLRYGDNLKSDIAFRVISDHIRMVSFSIIDGALPGNEGRAYVIRRILRRASRFAKNLGFNKPVIFQLVDVLIDIFKDTFPEIEKNKDLIAKVIQGEETSFLLTLENGLNKLNEIISNSKESNIINGEDAFLLYDSFGFPLDLTQLIAKENNFTVDEIRFNELMKEQKQRSKKSAKKNLELVSELDFDFNTVFTGYDELESISNVLYAKDNIIILDKSPFYIEKGGQISDTGIIATDDKKIKIIDAKQSGNSILHITDEPIDIDFTNKQATASVDKSRRLAIMKNHSATHLMHEALKVVLGDHIQQQGSLVNEKYLRFDFNHFQKLTQEELNKIEEIVNNKILESIDVITKEITLDEAKENSKIKMYFGDKYGSIVRVVKMDDNYSVELCGGTHVKNTSDIVFFKIITETSVSSGIRRIEAITGFEAYNYINKLNEVISSKDNHVNELKEKIKSLEKEILKLKSVNELNQIDELLKNQKLVNDIKLITGIIESSDIEIFREIAENLRNALKENGIALLAKVEESKVQLVCVVTDNLKTKYPAGKLVGLAAKELGGSGGGKDHLATAGAKDVDKLDYLLNQKFIEIIKNY